ncbi:MAG: restriction endonuclease subunit S [Sulfuricurvum sp.]|nr:restriction endonuclease subunit S [Sulfuricurvum sp.]
MNELYKLPNGWEWKIFDDVLVLIQNGISDTQNDDGVGYPISRIETIQNETLDSNRIKYVNINDDSTIEKYRYDYGDLLFSHINSFEKVGKVCLYTNQIDNLLHGVNLLRMKFVNDLDSKFIFYYLISNISRRFYEPHIKKAINQASINQKNIKSISIPVPPLSEQKRIVSKLDLLFKKIDKSIELHQKNMDEANAFMGSVLNEIFEEMDGQYKKEKLEKFDRKMSAGGTPLRAKNEYWDNGTIEWFSSGELNQQFTLPAKERITNEGLKNSSAKLFSKGTLLMGMYDTAAMKMSILHTDASCNQAIVGIKPNEDELNIFFLKYQLEYLKPKILEERQGVRQQNLNLSKIKNVEIEFPNIDIQIKVVEYLDSISEKMEKVKTIQKEKMESLKALKASILDKAFRGEL